MPNNPDATAFFAGDPDADYWYYSPTLRVTNPAKVRELLDNPRPFPNKDEQ